jgi:SAM-dependent methyltransferase
VVHRRRVSVLAQRLAANLPEGTTQLLDVGCGDGRLDVLLQEARPNLEIQGVEVLPRADCAIHCKSFDGLHLPFADGSFNGCMLVDVLHHTAHALPLLEDACRVSRDFVLIKDHIAQNAFDHWTLRFMDWIGNRAYGVGLCYTYLSAAQWQDLYRHANLHPEHFEDRLPLYPWPFSTIFGRKLHFIAVLHKSRPA